VIRGRGFTVRTGDGHLLVTQIQPAGRKPMSGVDAVNGNVIRKLDEFVSAHEFLTGSAEVE
jgi:methionyl-tRNA formyltransferase